MSVAYLQQKLLIEDSSLTLADLPSLSFVFVWDDDPICSLLEIEGDKDFVIVCNHQKEPVGLIDNLRVINKLIKGFTKIIPGENLPLIEFRNIVEQLGEEIFVTDGEGIILYLNPTAEKICQVKMSEVVGNM